jgi:hypothetical protein
MLRSKTELASLTQEWLAFLDAGALGPNMRNDPRRITLMLTLHPNLEPYVVVVRRGGQLKAVAPFYVEPTAFQLKWGSRVLTSRPFRSMQLFGDEVVMAESETDSTLRDVFHAIDQMQDAFDFMTISSLRRNSPLWRFCESVLPESGFKFTVSSAIEPVYQLRLPETYDEYLSGLGARTRQNLRRTTRRLFEDGLARVLSVTSPADVPEFLSHVERVHQRSWQARVLGRRRRDSQAELSYFKGLAEQGWLRAYVLLKAEQPLAFELGFQYLDTFYGHECAYDETAAAHGPGSVLMHLVIEDLFRSRKPERLHFGFGHAAYKQSFRSTDSHDAAHVTLVSKPNWRLVLRAQRLLDSAHRMLASRPSSRRRTEG